MSKMKVAAVAAVAAVALLLAGSTAFADVQLSIQNGRVTIAAKDATVRQILAEWARVGQTKIVNLERIPGGPITIELTNVSEQEALDVLLRNISGYIAAPRLSGSSAPSAFDRIVVMPTTAPPRAAVAAAPAPAAFQQPQQFQPPPAVDDDQEQRPAGAPGPNPRGPVFNAFPQPQIATPPAMPTPTPGFANPQQAMPQQPAQPPAQQAAPTAFPMPYGGVAVPGMVVQPPPQPGQPGQTQPATQPRRPGGGPDAN